MLANVTSVRGAPSKASMAPASRPARAVRAVRCQAESGKKLWQPSAKRLTRLQDLSALNKSDAITGMTMESFDGVSEVTTKQGELDQIAQTQPSDSFARKMYAPECEAAVNRQINIEYSISYLYHAMHAFFDRDNVGLPGFSEYFKQESDEEREHAEGLIKYQNLRGGRVVLGALMSPITEFDHEQKGEALYAMELALSLEKLNFEKLMEVHQVADEAGDAALCDFIEGDYLEEQVEAINKVAKYVAQLRRIGKGHAVWHFDQQLSN
mmetsp:Transcript_9775/g.19612  ORF Transcript_9775/g.19612 Transcript_9775/m.19612 type:complete len:267 (+) Transcript_9775:334-1134(+)